jgi:hypothetical protein
MSFYNQLCSFQQTPLYFISLSFLTLSIIFIASNEPQSITDAVLYDSKKTMFVSLHPFIHPSYGTTAHSQPFASYNFCLQIVLFCAVSCQLWHRKSLAAHSCTTSSHFKLVLTSGRLPVKSACMVFWVQVWEWEFVHVQYIVVSTSIHASAETNLKILSISTFFASYHWISSLQHILCLCHY